MYAWLLTMLSNCNEQDYRRNKKRMLRLAEFSRDALKELRTETGLLYDHREGGTLQLFRKAAQLDGVAKDAALLDEHGVAYEILDRAGCIRAEPALDQVTGKFVGGLRLPGDETGDAHMFTQGLASLCEKRGVVFRYGVDVKGLVSNGSEVSGLETVQGDVLVADAYVAAMGSFTPALLRALGIRLPVYPVKGYSLTMPVTVPSAAPVSTVMDETFKVAITRLGDRIRVGGTAELVGFDMSLRRPRRETLVHSLRELFPHCGDPATASFWSGLRPMTPDGTPVVGGTSFRNLYTNTGHGTLGWTMACGSGRLLADLVSGRTPEIEHEDLSIARYGT